VIQKAKQSHTVAANTETVYTLINIRR